MNKLLLAAITLCAQIWAKHISNDALNITEIYDREKRSYFRNQDDQDQVRSLSTAFTTDYQVESWPYNKEVFVVGDLHGDFLVTLSLLHGLGVVDGDGRWNGGSNILIQLGDVADRGPDSPAIYQLLWRLRTEAEAEGGRVYLLLGNHEVMNLMSQTHYVSPRETQVYYKGTPRELNAVWNPQFGYLGTRILRNQQTILQLGDVIFVHAGLVGDTFPYLDPATLHRSLVEGILGYATGNRNKVMEHREVLEGETSPVWTRLLASGADETRVCRLLDEANRARNATHQVVGHTPTRSGLVETRCGGAYVMADTANSRWMGGQQPAALKLTMSKLSDKYGRLEAKRSWEVMQVTKLTPTGPETKMSRLMSDVICYGKNYKQIDCSSGEDVVRTNPNVYLKAIGEEL